MGGGCITALIAIAIIVVMFTLPGLGNDFLNMLLFIPITLVFIVSTVMLVRRIRERKMRFLFWLILVPVFVVSSLAMHDILVTPGWFIDNNLRVPPLSIERLERDISTRRSPGQGARTFSTGRTMPFEDQYIPLRRARVSNVSINDHRDGRRREGGQALNYRVYYISFTVYYVDDEGRTIWFDVNATARYRFNRSLLYTWGWLRGWNALEFTFAPTVTSIDPAPATDPYIA